MQKVIISFLNINQIKPNREFIEQEIDERRLQKANRYVHENSALLSLGAAWLIHKYVGDYYVDEHGKPRSESLFFNVSHSSDLVVIAISDSEEIGIDIEKDADKNKELVSYCLSEEEIQEYDKGVSFLELFVSKESIAKADGKGLSSNIKSIPALPLNGKAEYMEKSFYRHNIKKEGYFVSITLENKDFYIIEEENNEF